MKNENSNRFAYEDDLGLEVISKGENVKDLQPNKESGESSEDKHKEKDERE